VRVYKAIGSFKGESAFTTWLHRIVTNCFLDMRKKAAVRMTVSLDSEINLGESEVERQFSDDAPSPYMRAEQGERESRIAKAVSRLPEYQRAIIHMYHVDMMSYEEIAETLDLPIGTVKSRLNRARLSLRDLLSHERELFALAA